MLRGYCLRRIINDICLLSLLGNMIQLFILKIFAACISETRYWFPLRIPYVRIFTLYRIWCWINSFEEKCFRGENFLAPSVSRQCSVARYSINFNRCYLKNHERLASLCDMFCIAIELSELGLFNWVNFYSTKFWYDIYSNLATLWAKVTR